MNAAGRQFIGFFSPYKSSRFCMSTTFPDKEHIFRCIAADTWLQFMFILSAKEPKRVSVYNLRIVSCSDNFVKTNT